MAYYWELRRILRQKIRSYTPKKPLSYQQWSRRRLLVSFVLFFVGWKAIGFTLNDFLLWKVDEVSGEGRFLTPAEGKKRRADMIQAHKMATQPPSPPSSFALDD